MTDHEKDYFFDLNGYLILRNALSPEKVKAMNAWIDGQPPRKPGEWIGNVHVHSYGGIDGTNYQNIVEGGALFEDLIDSSAWTPDLRRWICNDYNRLSINECFINVREKGGYIGVHSGGHYPCFPMTTRHQSGQWMVGQVNVLMALTDIGPGDGATVLIPGSHKCVVIHPLMAQSQIKTYRSTEPASEAAGSVEIHLKAGDAVMFTDAVTHGSTERTNPGQRRICIYRYSPHCYATRFNYIPSEELMQRLSPERRSMIQPVAPRLAPGQVLRGAEPALVR